MVLLSIASRLCPHMFESRGIKSVGRPGWVDVVEDWLCWVVVWTGERFGVQVHVVLDSPALVVSGLFQLVS